ncbi:MAG: hypothetical protein EXQ96_10530 [Alphaproteobacteria bacterium]|nr:hypothetical protein [Alphaproteobacteria bacterium]
MLHAITRVPELRTSLLLKGRALIAVVYNSPRATTDLDFTAATNPETLPALFEDAFDRALRAATAALGHLDLICRVQKIQRRPRPSNYTTARFPALSVGVGFAVRGTAAEGQLERK